jgi:hypothetical protein
MAEVKSLPADDDEVSRTWNERPDIIRQFIEARPQYEQLCSEVAYILKSAWTAVELSTPPLQAEQKH